jgi:hypothetical protein
MMVHVDGKASVVIAGLVKALWLICAAHVIMIFPMIVRQTVWANWGVMLQKMGAVSVWVMEHHVVLKEKLQIIVVYVIMIL